MRVISDNRKAYYEYEIESRIEAGVSLNGGEFKSVRRGEINLRDSFCHVYDGEMWLKNCFIAHYDKGSHYNEDERRDRRLLLHKHEIRKIAAKIREKGYTVIPTKAYYNEKGKVKIELALARGKKLHDKRAALKEKDLARATQRTLSQL